MTIVYFSPTGNTRFLAERLSNHLGETETELLALEFTNPAKLKKSDQLILLYSIHAFNPPRTVRRFVDGIPSELFNSVSILSVGCAEGWQNAAASSGLRATLEKKGYSIHLDEVVAMPLTFIMSFPEQTGRKVVDTAESKIEKAASSIKTGMVSENHPPVKSKIVHFIGKAEDTAARAFGLELHAGKNCTSCGICVKNCPEGNIRFNKKNVPKFGLSCLMCMRCIYNCPENAISPRLSKFIPIKNGYNISNYTSN